MEDKDRPGDDALQEEQEPCRQADHGGQTFSSCTQSHRMFLNLVFCIFFLALCTYNVYAFGFTCGDCHGSSMSFDMGAFLQPYYRLAMTAAFCYELYKASEKFRYPKWESLCNLTAGLL
jgi:hypothetical protein